MNTTTQVVVVKLQGLVECFSLLTGNVVTAFSVAPVPHGTGPAVIVAEAFQARAESLGNSRRILVFLSLTV